MDWIIVLGIYVVGYLISSRIMYKVSSKAARQKWSALYARKENAAERDREDRLFYAFLGAFWPVSFPVVLFTTAPWATDFSLSKLVDSLLFWMK